MSEKPVKTPCVGLCSTVYGDLVCRGCKRYHHEIVNWNLYGEREKRAVWLRLEDLLGQVVSTKLEVFDRCQLQSQMRHRGIACDASRSSAYWVYQLLLKGSRHIRSLHRYGVATLPLYAHMLLPELRELIDQEYFQLAEAHYQRYIAPGLDSDGLSPRRDRDLSR